jgi:hypothetical protein
VVLAVALDLDVAQQHHVVIALHVLERAAQLLGRIGFVAFEPFGIGVHDALGRVLQALPVGVVTGPGQQGAHGLQGLLARRPQRHGIIADKNRLRGMGVHERCSAA